MKTVLPVQISTRQGTVGAQCLWMDRNAMCLVTPTTLTLKQTVVGNIALGDGPTIRALLTIVDQADKPMRRGNVYAARWRVHDPQQRERLLHTLRQINPEGNLPPVIQKRALPRLGHRFMHAPGAGGGSIYLSLESAEELQRLATLDGKHLKLRLPSVENIRVGDRLTMAIQLHDGIVIDVLVSVTAERNDVLTMEDPDLTASARAILMRVFEPEHDPPSLISLI